MLTTRHPMLRQLRKDLAEGWLPLKDRDALIREAIDWLQDQGCTLYDAACLVYGRRMTGISVPHLSPDVLHEWGEMVGVPLRKYAIALHLPYGRCIQMSMTTRLWPSYHQIREAVSVRCPDVASGNWGMRVEFGDGDVFFDSLTWMELFEAQSVSARVDAFLSDARLPPLSMPAYFVINLSADQYALRESLMRDSIFLRKKQAGREVPSQAGSAAP